MDENDSKFVWTRNSSVARTLCQPIGFISMLTVLEPFLFNIVLWWMYCLVEHWFRVFCVVVTFSCHKYINEYIASYIHCEPACMHLNRYGQIVSQHVRDLTWNFNHYISTLYKDLKSWRKVYWRLWGNCHYLYCATCETYFPLYQVTTMALQFRCKLLVILNECEISQMNWCLYHPDQPQYLGPLTEGRMAGPAGRYPCCGQQAFRFETLPGPMVSPFQFQLFWFSQKWLTEIHYLLRSQGCQYREHTIQIFNDRDRQILKLAQIASDGSGLYEIAPNGPTTSTAATANECWWNGIALMPTKERPGLLPSINLDGEWILNWFKVVLLQGAGATTPARAEFVH